VFLASLLLVGLLPCKYLYGFGPSRAESNTTPNEAKERPTSSGPIAQIPLTDKERLGTSIPLFASNLANTTGKLFLDQHSNPEQSNN
jgi:hypothetical protein